VLSRFLFVLVLLAATPAAAAPELSCLDYTWQNIGKGLSFTRLEVLEKKEIVESLEVVRIDPNLNSFRLFHDSPRKISEWEECSNATVIFNGSYLLLRGNPVAWC
jgi:hypothetical protein